MHDHRIKAAVSGFLRNVNHTAQKEIEKMVANALKSGKLKSSDDLQAAVTLQSEKLGLNVTIHGRIEL